jgi:hypothetical protein
MNIEEEFQTLMQEAISKVEEKKSRGEIDQWDALNLIQKIENCLDHGDTSNYGNRCPEGHTDPDCGWSPSMGYHCI